jgi:hypothetical protein
MMIIGPFESPGPGTAIETTLVVAFDELSAVRLAA